MRDPHVSQTTTPDPQACRNGCGRTALPPIVLFGESVFNFKLCRECSDAEAARDAAEEEQRREDKRTLARANATRHLIDQVGPRLGRYTLDSFPHGREPAVSACLRWLVRYRRNRAGNLILHGPAGTGKTGLAVSTARALTERIDPPRGNVEFVVTRDWLDEIRKATFRSPADAEAVEAPARRAPVLILDDLGSERATPLALERLLSLVDHRYRHELPIIVTSNFSPSRLVVALSKDDETVGERIVSRLIEDAVQVQIGYGNLRLRKAA